MFSYVSIKDKYLQSLFELSKCLSEKWFGIFNISRKIYFREILIKLRKHHFLSWNNFIVILTKILIYDSHASKLKQVTNKISNRNLNCGS